MVISFDNIKIMEGGDGHGKSTWKDKYVPIEL